MAALEFRLPDVGEGIATAEIIAWQVAEGDRVREHQDLVEIQTDKATVVIPCPADGVVTRLCGEPGDTLDVGAVLAVIERRRRGRNGAPARARRGGRRAAVPRAPRAPDAARRRARAGAPLAAPTTRRLARELGVGARGRWPGAARTGASCARTSSAPRPARRAARPRPATAPPARPAPPRGSPLRRRAAPAPGEVVPLRGVRRTIAHALTRAWLEVPRIIDYREVDATALVRARASLRRRAVERGDEALAKALTPTPFAVARRGARAPASTRTSTRRSTSRPRRSRCTATTTSASRRPAPTG